MMMMGDRKKHLLAILGEPKKPEPENTTDEGKAIADEMIEAFHSRDADALWAAIKAAFDKLDSEPHVEGSHLE